MARNNSSQLTLSENKRNLIIKATRYIPYYDQLYRAIIPLNDNVRQIETSTGIVKLQVRDHGRSLDYPKQILQCRKSEQPLNIVIIGIDSWRYDTMNARVTPNIYQFAQKSQQFQNHWSGGNCTQAGLFSLFYGIPTNYWSAALEQKRGPELLNQLMKANYSVTVFASAQLNFPAFDETIFRDVKPLIIKRSGETSVARDRAITQELTTFLQTRNKQQPFFSFLFYDAVHNYCEQEKLVKHPFKPWKQNCNRLTLTKKSNREPYFNRYKNTVHFVDNEIKQVLNALKNKNC